MGFEWFDYDPVTGITEEIAWEDGKMHIRQTQDVEPALDFAKYLANTGATDTAAQKKADWRLYAMLPPVIVADMFKRGINLMDPNDTKKVLDEINTKYQHFKTTTKHHAIK
jgi:hypothetical protein